MTGSMRCLAQKRGWMEVRLKTVAKKGFGQKNPGF